MRVAIIMTITSIRVMDPSNHCLRTKAKDSEMREAKKFWRCARGTLRTQANGSVSGANRKVFIHASAQ